MMDSASAVHQSSSRLDRWSADIRELLGSGFLQNVIGSLGSKAVLLALSVVTAVTVTRALGPDGRGLFATAVAMSAIGMQLGNLGLHASNTWAVARDRAILGALVANSLLASAIAGGIVIVGILIVAAVWPGSLGLSPDLLALALISIPIGIAFLLLQNLFLGLDRIRAYNGLEIANRAAATLVLVALAIAGIITAVNAFAVVVVLWGLASLLSMVLLMRGRSLRLVPSRTLIFEHARYGIKAYLGALASFLLLRVDVLLVQSMLGSEQTGYYSVAASLADNILLLPIVVGSLLFARLSAIADPVSQWRIARAAAAGLAVVMFAISVLAVFLSEPVIRILFGQAFLPSVNPFIWLLPGLVLLSINLPFMNYFGAIGMPLVVVVGPFLALTINVVLNLGLIPAYGIVGASAASSVAYGSMLAFNAVYLWRRSNG